MESTTTTRYTFPVQTGGIPGILQITSMSAAVDVGRNAIA